MREENDTSENDIIRAQDQGMNDYFNASHSCPYPSGSLLAASWLEAYCLTAETNTDKRKLS